MFREMRRNAQSLPIEECKEILKEQSCGVLGLQGDDGYPYAVPVSYVCDGEKLYVHSAVEGHKIDSIERCDKVSFCVIAQNDVQEEKFTTFYKSVIVFGRAKIYRNDEEKISIMRKIAGKYSPGMSREATEAKISSTLARLVVIEIEPEHITGKIANGLMQMRNSENKN